MACHGREFEGVAGMEKPEYLGPDGTIPDEFLDRGDSVLDCRPLEW